MLLLVLAGSCRPATDRPSEPQAYLPDSASVVLAIHDPERFRSEFRNNGLLQNFKESQPNNALFNALDSLMLLDLNPDALISLQSTPDGPLLWLVTQRERTSPVADSLAASGTSAALAPTGNDSLWHSARENGVLLLSNSREFLNATLANGPAEDNRLSQALRTANPLAAATLLLPEGHRNPLSEFLTGPGDRRMASLDAEWSAFDLLLRSDALLLQGIELRPDSVWDQRTLVKEIPALPLQEAAAIAPARTRALYSISLSDARRFLSNQQQLLARTNPHPGLLESVERLSWLETGSEPILVLHALNPEAVDAALLGDRAEVSTFQDAPIYRLNSTARLRAAFEPLLNRLPDSLYYARLSNEFAFGPDLESLQDLISAHNRQETYAASASFGQLRQYLSSESSVLAIALEPGGSVLASDTLSPLGLPGKVAALLPETYLYTGQLVSEPDYDLVTYQFRKKDDPSGSGASVASLFTLKLEGQVQAGPFLLRNHVNGRMDIAVQDDQNQLYLYSDSGERYWKKELPGPIQGRIHQVDLFKNGRLQMVFTTPGTLTVLDRNGREVAPFPKSFPGGNLGPLAVFDYDNNRNYRLVFSQGNKVFMFDGQGRDVAGFKYRNAESPVLGTPDHIRIGSRDYLVFRLDNGTLKILNRVGDTRVRVPGQFQFSGNGVFLYRDNFAFTERTGNLITIDTRGRMNRAAMNLGEDHGMFATANTLALMNDNELRIKGHPVELDLGVYTAPQIFYLYDIIYVAVTDIQSQRLYLFRSDASRLPGFPVEGNGMPDMADMDGDRNPELAVRYRDSAIAVYRIQR